MTAGMADGRLTASASLAAGATDGRLVVDGRLAASVGLAVGRDAGTGLAVDFGGGITVLDDRGLISSPRCFLATTGAFICTGGFLVLSLSSVSQCPRTITSGFFGLGIIVLTGLFSGKGPFWPVFISPVFTGAPGFCGAPFFFSFSALFRINRMS